MNFWRKRIQSMIFSRCGSGAGKTGRLQIKLSANSLNIWIQYYSKTGSSDQGDTGNWEESYKHLTEERDFLLFKKTSHNG